MESILSSQEDHLLSSLSYKIPPNSGASYVTDRRAVTYFPMGGNIYNPSTGTRQIRFNLASDQFIDLSSLAVSFDLNMDTQLRPGLHSGWLPIHLEEPANDLMVGDILADVVVADRRCREHMRIHFAEGTPDRLADDS